MDDQTIRDKLKKSNVMYNRVRRTTGRDSIFFGVCGGLSRYVDPEADPVIMRLIWVFLGIFSGVFPVLIIYLVMALVLKRDIPEDPKEPEETPLNV